MDVGPYVPFLRRAVERRRYLNYIAADEAVRYPSSLSCGAAQKEKRAQVTALGRVPTRVKLE